MEKMALGGSQKLRLARNLLGGKWFFGGCGGFVVLGKVD